MNFQSMIQKTKFQVKAHSPELLIITGVIGVIASTVMACKATIKAKDIVEQAKEELDVVHENAEESPETAKKEIAVLYSHTALDLAKVYGPALILGAFSLGCIIKSNDILRKRNASLAAAYLVADQGFKEYRSRVTERFGKDVDQQILHNIKEQEIEEKTVDSKGNEKIKKKKVRVADINTESDYVKYFTRSNPHWMNDSGYNEAFFQMAQNIANEKLMASEYLTLNEVFDIFGFQHTKAGMVVGWTYNLKNPTGDNRVIFDIMDVCLTDEEGNFDHGYAIDFNVDGNIYDLMS